VTETSGSNPKSYLCLISISPYQRYVGLFVFAMGLFSASSSALRLVAFHYLPRPIANGYRRPQSKRSRQENCRPAREALSGFYVSLNVPLSDMCALFARIVNCERRKRKAGVPRRHFRTVTDSRRTRLRSHRGSVRSLLGVADVSNRKRRKRNAEAHLIRACAFLDKL